MRLTLPIEPLFILYKLHQAGYDGYIVGGAVRDILLAAQQEVPQPATDFDFTTNATPEQLLALFPESFYENQFGTVSIAPHHLAEMMGLSPTKSETDAAKENAQNKVIDVSAATKVHESLQVLPPAEKTSYGWEKGLQRNYEITTYRSEGSYKDHRRPDSVTWGKTIHDDLSRRDFTVNAMALKIAPTFLEQTISQQLSSEKHITLDERDCELIDLFGGLQDLKEFVIRSVGEPAVRFQEDALRMLRAVRLSVQLNMKMTDETFTAISELGSDIQHVSWERIRDEFLKMLNSQYPAEAIELLEETGLLHYILPELREGKNIDQAGHHTTDVWTHSLDALRTCPSHDPIVRLATLLHDVGKPRTFKVIDNKITFYNHEIVGARMVKEIGRRLRLSKTDIDRLYVLVRYHMFHYQPFETDAAIRRFMRKVGLNNVNDILDLREADRLGSGARKTSWRLEEMKERMIEQLHQPFSIKDMKINGNDLMSELGLKPGPQLGQILKNLFEKVLENPELNKKEKLLELAQQETSS
jgi:tRNA nucleotidyltransferase (CCA-adding enzyme)